MAKVGRPGRTPAQRIIDGDKRGRAQDGNVLTWAKMTEVPSPPDHFNEATSDIFLNFCNLLANKGLLFETDLQSIEELSINIWMEREAIKELNENGLFVMYTNKGGETNRVKNPAIDILKQSQSFIATWLPRFGLTLDSKMKIIVPDDNKEEGNPLELLQNQ